MPLSRIARIGDRYKHFERGKSVLSGERDNADIVMKSPVFCPKGNYKQSLQRLPTLLASGPRARAGFPRLTFGLMRIRHLTPS